MRRNDELVERLCPDGVDHATLGETGTFIRGNGIQKKDFTPSGVGCIHYGQIFTHFGLSATATKSFVSPELAARSRKAVPGDLIIATTSENDEDVCKAVAWLGDDPVAVSSDAMIYRHSLDPKYVAYFFDAGSFRAQKRSLISGTKVRRVSSEALAKIRIPVPPLAIQREIVQVLDKFTQLEAELEAELEARRRQYEHFASRLLASGHGADVVRFGDVATIVRGASPRPIQNFFTLSDHGVPWIKIGDVPADGKYITGTSQRVSAAGAAKSRMVRPGDFVLSNSMSFGRPYISQIDGAIHDGWLAISDFEESFVPDYLYYLLRSGPVQSEFARRAGSGTVQNLNADIVKGITLPVPSRERQMKVVALLDRFDLLVNDLSTGLPAELAARRKQYEHYRDRLLTFKEFAA